MKKIILVTMFLSTAAQADIIRCGFTEPFITTTYSMTQQTLSYKEDGSGKVKVIKGVSFQIKDAGKFELVGKDGKVLQALKLTNNGSDGMSDTIYPFVVRDSVIGASAANSGVGGCSSNF